MIITKEPEMPEDVKLWEILDPDQLREIKKIGRALASPQQPDPDEYQDSQNCIE
jgi:hypothetical protein